jgi:hypothetical protein
MAKLLKLKSIRIIAIAFVIAILCSLSFAIVPVGATSSATITISTEAVADIGTTSAVIRGNVTATGGSDPTVTMYWGTADGGQTPGSWQHNGTATYAGGVATFYLNISSLTAGQLYYFSASADNTGGGGGVSWAGASKSFTTTTSGVDDSYTQALLHMDGANSSTTFTDEAGHTVTASGTSELSTSASEFGGVSGYFDGSTNCFLQIPESSSEFNFGTGNFTIDFWFNSPGESVNYPNIVTTSGGWSSGSFGIRYSNTGRTSKVTVHWNPVGDPCIISTDTFSINTWHHVAVERTNSTTLVLYVDGNLEGSVSISSSQALDLGYGGYVQVGGETWDGASQGYYTGYVDELRISKGIARWTSNFSVPTQEYAPISIPTDEYWVGGTGLWSDTAHWSLSSGGSGGAPVPAITTNVHFDVNSFTGGGQYVRINTSSTPVAYCNNIDFTNVDDTPALWLGYGYEYGYLDVAGNLTFSPNMTVHVDGEGGQIIFVGSSSNTITTNGVLSNISYGAGHLGLIFNGTGTWTLQDDLVANYSSSLVTDLTLTTGTLVTNNKTVTLPFGAFSSTGTGVRALTLGSSVFSCGSWDATIPTNFTLTAGTSTINDSGNFYSGGKTYNSVILTGNASIGITGSSTSDYFEIDRGTGRTVTVAHGTTQTSNDFVFPINGTNILTLQSDSGGNQWYLSQATSIVYSDYLALTDSNATGGASFYAGANSTTNPDNNNGWIWTAAPTAPTIATTRATSVFGTRATLQGTLSAIGIYSPIYVYFQYASDSYYVNNPSSPYQYSTTQQSESTAPQTITQAVTTLTTGVLYHYRIVALYNTSYYVYGNDATFTTTSNPNPVVETVAATNPTINGATLQGTVDSLGQMTGGVIVYFSYGLTNNYGNTTTQQIMLTTGSFNYVLSNLVSGTTYHYQAVLSYNGTTTTGVDMTFVTATLPAIPITQQPYSPSGGTGGSTNPNTVQSLTQPTSWWANNSAMSSLPFYSDFDDAATGMNPDNPTTGHPTTAVLYLMAILATAMAAGYGVLLFTGSGLLALGVIAVFMSIGASMTIVSGWMVFLIQIAGGGIWFLAKYI